MVGFLNEELVGIAASGLFGSGAGSLNESNIIGTAPGLGLPEMPLQLAGAHAATQPIFDTENAAVIELHREIVTLGSQVGLTGAAAGVVKLGESIGPGFVGANPNPYGDSNLVTDVVNLPSNVLSGDTAGLVDNVSADIDQILDHASLLKDTLIFGSPTNDPSNPVPEIIQAVGTNLSTGPIVDLSGENGIIGGVIGDLSGSASGHLIDIDIGPQQEGGLVLDVLSSLGMETGHTIELNILDVGSTGPTIADLNLLTDIGDLGAVTSLVPQGDQLLPDLLAITQIAPLDIGGLSDLLSGNGLSGLHLV